MLKKEEAELFAVRLMLILIRHQIRLKEKLRFPYPVQPVSHLQ